MGYHISIANRYYLLLHHEISIKIGTFFTILQHH